MASKQPKLELLGELWWDRTGHEPSEAGVDPVRVLSRGLARRSPDDRPGGVHLLAGIVGELAPRAVDSHPPDVVDGEVFPVQRDGRRKRHAVQSSLERRHGLDDLRSEGGEMRIIVMSDMEGVAGIVKWEQVEGGESLYEEGRKLYTEEINAVVRGARAGGATEIVVMDCHGAGKGWAFNSLLPEALDPGCDWVVQHEWTHYTAFLEQGCDGALLVGMHARAGTATGVLNHTVSGADWHNLWFNDTLVGETGINAALCGTWNCPVLMVSGTTQPAAKGSTCSVTASCLLP